MIQIAEANRQEGYFDQIDGLRFIAVLFVMLGHWVPSVRIFYLSPSGVNLFFVLSGFLIARILILNKLRDAQEGRTNWRSIRQFYFRRALRIFPIYYLIIFIAFFASVYPIDRYFVWFLTYMSNVLWANNVELGTNFTHLWSLAVEEQFYVFFPFLIFSINIRHLNIVFYFLIAIAVFSRYLCSYYFGTPNVAQYALMPCALDSFSIGAILAYLHIFNFKKLAQILSNRTILIIALVIFVAACISNLYFKGNLFYYLFFRLSFSVISFWIIGIASLGLYKGYVLKFLRNNYVVYFGKISYGIYLYHKFIPNFTSDFIKVFIKTFPFMNSTITSFTVNFIATIIISSISWYLIEQPINGLKRFFEYRKSTPFVENESLIDSKQGI